MNQDDRPLRNADNFMLLTPQTELFKKIATLFSTFMYMLLLKKMPKQSIVFLCLFSRSEHSLVPKKTRLVGNSSANVATG